MLSTIEIKEENEVGLTFVKGVSNSNPWRIYKRSTIKNMKKCPMERINNGGATVKEVNFKGSGYGVAEEDEFCKSEAASESIEDEASHLDLLLVQPTMVYTTKLEDMKTLQKNFSDYDAKEIIQMLLDESKPKYEANNATHSTGETNLLSYVKVVSCAEEINLKAKLEAHNTQQRNAELLMQCKPCSVVLQDINKNVVCRSKRQETETISLSDSDVDDVPLIKMKKLDNKLKISLNKTALVVLLHNNKVAYVYHFHLISKIVTEYVIIKEYDEYKLREMYPKEPKLILKYCCWYKREAVIESISLGNILNKKNNILLPLKTFMKQPHGCYPGQCLCCCYVDDNKSDKKSQIPRYEPAKILMPSNSGSSDNQSSTNKYYGDIVRKAMYGKPRENPKETVIQQKDTSSNLNHNGYVLLLRIEKQKELNAGIEFYVIKENDIIIDSCTVHNKDVAKEIEKEYISMSLPVVTKKYCCWHSRKSMINCLKIQKFSPVVLKFLRTPHTCEINKCYCCCKPKKILEQNVELLKRIQARQWTYTHWPAVLNHTTAYNKNPILKVIPETITPYINSTKNIATAKVQQPIQSDPKSTKPEDDNHILNKFKQLKISVNLRGELEAVLDAPARNLSIVELKVLHHILTLSSKQIAQMQISPEEFCHRVNTHPITNSNDIMQGALPIPEVASTIPEQTQKKTRLGQKRLPRIVQIDYNNKNSTTPSITIESDIYKELSEIMSIKNKHLANSFRTNCKVGVFCALNHFPEFRKFPPLQLYNTNLDLSSNEPNAENKKTLSIHDSSSNDSTESVNNPTIPKIASVTSLYNNTFPASTKAKHRDSTQKKKRIDSKRKASPANVAKRKRIRVKAPSELMDTNANQNAPVAITNTTSQPIIINLGTSSQQFINQPTYVLTNSFPNNLVPIVSSDTASTDQIPRIIIGNSVNESIAPDPTSPSQGTKWMTIGPIQSQDQFGSLLTKMLQTKHVQPSIKSFSNALPPLVPIGSPIQHINGPSTSDAISSMPSLPQTTPKDVALQQSYENIVHENSQRKSTSSNNTLELAEPDRKTVYLAHRQINRNINAESTYIYNMVQSNNTPTVPTVVIPELFEPSDIKIDPEDESTPTESTIPSNVMLEQRNITAVLPTSDNVKPVSNTNVVYLEYSEKEIQDKQLIPDTLEINKIENSNDVEMMMWKNPFV